MYYKKIKYPDGQLSVELQHLSPPSLIAERINSYEDLFFIKSIAEAYNNAGIEDLPLFIPCLFGQRSDRRFAPNNSFDLKIIVEFINSCNFKSVQVFDPHSDVSLALINNCHKVSSFSNVAEATSEIGGELTLIAPDAGAYKKVFEYGQKLSLPVTGAMKHRDKDGKVELKFVGDVKDKNCLIVDDLCDGGYTFVTLAQQLKDQGAADVYLYVSHGYFSKGFDELKKNIKRIYCTNSVKDVEDPFVRQVKII